MSDRLRAIFEGARAGTITRDEALAELNRVLVPVEPLRPAVERKLVELFARASHFISRAVDPTEPFESYGIDSIMIIRLNQDLAEHYRDLPKTLFFEFRTIAELAAHLAVDRPAESVKWTGVRVAPGPARTKPLSPSDPGADRACRVRTIPSRGPIAIIGMTGRFPGARDLDVFWRNLADGRESVVEIPRDRWSLEGFFESDRLTASRSGRSYSRWGGFIEGFDEFDPRFFQIAPSTARAIDPQERLFLQAAWEAIEDAGYTRRTLAQRHDGNVGVFAGVTKTGFNLHGLQLPRERVGCRPSTSFSSLANRVSFFLDLRGPSVPVDTMCSSSLTAIHQACVSLQTGECELALAGAANLYLHPMNFVELCADGMLSSDGRCRSFGAGADGFVPGEGVACLVLKPLENAIADGDQIHAVIRGSAVNHGGRANGYTVPRPGAQAGVIRAAFDRAGVSARDVGYIEAHGTGTELGDPIEIEGLVRAFAGETGAPGSCAIGSVKSNIGHLEAAAGIAGVIKVVLQMRHRKLVPSLHADQLNPNIALAATPFRLQRELEEWKAGPAGRRIAGVSSFGAGGANAHVVLEDFHEAPVDESLPHLPEMIVLSARTDESLKENARKLLEFLRDPIRDERCRRATSDAGFFRNVAWTLQTGREAMEERLAFEADSLEGLVRSLEAFLGGSTEGLRRGNARSGREILAAIGDRELKNLLEKRVAERGIAGLLELWVKGAEVDFSGFHDAPPPRRVSLPGYAFARERYWIRSDEFSQSENLPRVRSREMLLADLDGWGRFQDAFEIAIWNLTVALLDASGLLRKDRIVDKYRRWFDATVAASRRAGLLKNRDDGSFVPAEPSSDLALAWRTWDARKAAWLEDSDTHARVMLVENALRSLPAILTGKTLATDVLFPKSSLELVEGVYKRNRVSDYFNGVLADAIDDFVRSRIRRDPSVRLRFIEIGAGTGGTTELVLDRLSRFGANIAEYAYTDVSKAFLIHAKKTFMTRYPFVTCELFDMDTPVALQKSAGSRALAGRYDALVATHVLHAGRDIRRAVRNVRELLTAEGGIFLNEVGANTAFTHVTFGLLDGWWRYEDEELRIPGCPALLPETWRNVLEESGFRRAGFPAAAAHDLGQQIIVAENNFSREATAAPRVTPVPVLTEDRVRETIVSILASALDVDSGDISVGDSFADFGLDSIIGSSVVHSLNSELGTEFETTVLFEYSNVKALTRHIVERTFVAAPTTIDRNESPASGARISNERSDRDPIAVIGMSGRFAQSPDLETLWKNLIEGRNLVTRADRWDLSDVVDEYARNGENFCMYGSFLDDIDRFDPFFFKISGVEAAAMDPQQRLFLEESWKALEDAGYAGRGVEGRRVGVYVGGCAGDYRDLLDRRAPAQAFWANAGSLIPARIAYALDLRGPAVAVDAACSSSLVAIHMACRAILTGEVDFAISGGVFVQSTPYFLHAANRAGMLSPSGRCHPFDASADGIVPGEGVGVVVLKRLDAALADGDHVHGVIVGSGINQDGTTNGITAPNAASQERLEREVYEKHGVDPAGIQFVEAHGTGTRLGDPIEWDALTRAFRHFTARSRFCAIGSIKANLGHATTAAGVAGLLKVLLALRHRTIPPSINCEEPNPAIDFETSPFYVNTAPEPWKIAPGSRRRAAISSFGFSGTNAHLVVEEGPEIERGDVVRAGYIFVLSARSRKELEAQARRIRDFVERRRDVSCADMSFTLLVGRKHFSHRLAFAARDHRECVETLDAYLEGRSRDNLRLGEVDERAFTEDPSSRLHVERALDEALASESERVRRALTTAAELFVKGHELDGGRLNRDGGARRVPMPTYPFARLHCWTDAQPAVAEIGPPRPRRGFDGPERTHDGKVKLPDPESISTDFERVGGAGRVAWSTLETPREEVSEAEEILAASAGRVASHPREAVEELKNHMTSEFTRLSRSGDEGEWRKIIAVNGKTGSPAALESTRMIGPVMLEGFDDGVLLVSMRDENGKNAFTEPMMDALTRVFAEAPVDSKNKVVVLTGYGSWFASGGTREGLESLQKGRTRFTDRKIYSLPLECELPVIAAMQGHGIGAGWSLGLFADIILHGEESVYTSNYLSYGFTPGAGATLIVPYKLGRRLGWEILFSAAEYKGAELRARRAELTVLRRDEVLRTALAMAHSLARSPRSELVATKNRVMFDLRTALPETLRRELAMHERTLVGNPEVARRIREKFEAPSPERDRTAESPPGSRSVASTFSAGGTVCEFLRRTLAAEIQMDPGKVSDNETFLDMGMDSILGVTWVRRINKEYGLEIPATAVYAHPTIEAFSAFIIEEGSRRGVCFGTGKPSEPETAPDRADRSEPSFVSALPAIAVIGMSGRFPKAPDIEALWRNIAGGVDCVSEIPAEKWAASRFDPGDPENALYRWMGVLEESDLFDPRFFGLTPREADAMEPQQRIFLEEAWHCLEDAAVDPRDLAGKKCGIFVGCGRSEYGDGSNKGDAYALMGTAGSILASRLAYLLDLRGPSVALDTACSSSLVAIASACSSLVLGETELALAGGVDIQSGPGMHLMTARAGMLSKTGRCRAFDDRADGFIPGEGVGVLLLKRLGDAERDGDPIHGIIRGWGINQDGKTNGITAPNPDSQARLEEEIYRKFAIDPERIGLVEAHGTGTVLGDPIEVEGLTKAFRSFTTRKGFCALGSVKSNIGHLLAAAGVTGAIKALLALRERKLPPTIHFEKINPHLAIENSPFFISTALQDWRVETGARRMAAVSSFGFSGTNAHIVIEEASCRPLERSSACRPFLFVLSARTEAALARQSRNLSAWIGSHSGISAESIAYTLQTGREEMKHRLAVIASSRDELLGTLSDIERGIPSEAVVTGVAADNPPVFPADDLRRLAEAWVCGARVDWSMLYPDGHPARCRPPGYPFERECCRRRSEENRNDYGLLVKTVSTVYDAQADPASGSELERPSVHFGSPAPDLIRAFTMLECAWSAAAAFAAQPVFGLRNIFWTALPDRPVDGSEHRVRFYRDDSEFLYEVESSEKTADTPPHFGEVILEKTMSSDRVDIAALRARLAHTEFGSGAPVIRDIFEGDSEFLASLHLVDGPSDDGTPLRADCVEAIWSLLERDGVRRGRSHSSTLYPRALGEIQASGTLPDRALLHLVCDSRADNREMKCTATICDEDGRVLLALTDLVVEDTEHLASESRT